MRPAVRAVLAAALLLATVPAAQAQETVGLSFSVSPPSRTVAENATAVTYLVVRNDGVATRNVDLTADPSPLAVALERTNVSLDAGQTVQVRAEVSAAGAKAGTNHSITFRARDRDAPPLFTPAQRAATFTLYVTAPPAANATTNGTTNGTATTPPPADTGPADASPDSPDGDPEGPPGSSSTADPPAGGEEPADRPDPVPESTDGTQTEDTSERVPPNPPPPTPGAPTLTPAEMTLNAPVRVRVPFRLDLSHPHAETFAYDVMLRLPMGWTGGVDVATVTLGPHGSAAIEGWVQPLANAAPGEATLFVAGPGGEASARLRLRPESPPPAEDRSPPARNASETVAVETPPPPPPQGVTLRVEPAEAMVPAGGRAPLQLLIVNGGDAPLRARLALLVPFGFTLDTEPALVDVPPGATLSLPFVLRAAASLETGERARAEASLMGVDAAPALFEVVVGPPVGDADEDPAVTLTLQTRQSAGLAWGLAAALAAVGAGAVLAAWAWRRRETLLLVLYARLRPDRMLEHPTRRAMRDIVQAEPGILLADLQKRMGLANGAMRHHLTGLERAKIVRTVRDGAHRRVFPAGAPRVEAQPGLAERVVATLHESGPLPAADLAARLGVSRQALHYHVKRLAAQGRIETRMVGRELVLAPPAPRGENARAAP